jgi:hypothetical protein
VTIAWFIAISGESTEKYYIKRRVYYKKTRRPIDEDVIDVEAKSY